MAVDQFYADSIGKLIRDELWPLLRAERQRLDFLDRWYRYEPDAPHRPRQATAEYKQLADRSGTPWLNLVVTGVAQALYVEGYRSQADDGEAKPWSYWQRNRMDSRQIALHRAALAFGVAYTLNLPGIERVTGESMPLITGVDPHNMLTYYDDPESDEWPEYALKTKPVMKGGKVAGWVLTLYDDEAAITYGVNGKLGSGEMVHLKTELHDIGVCPVVRYTNTLDLRGRSDGEVEPFIPLAARINQTVFDRLVVQRFASWKVRTIAGMTPPADISEAEAKKLKLAVDAIMVAADKDTKFGTLDATPLDGFVLAKEADIRDLAATSQTPPHWLLGSIANLSAEALAAAEASLDRKVDERQHTFGESHEQTLRLCAHIDNDQAAAADFTAQVRWKDTSSRSLGQVADALGKLATMLGVPVQMLWNRIPGWTDQDTKEAERLVEEGGGVEALLSKLVAGSTSPAVEVAPPAATPPALPPAA